MATAWARHRGRLEVEILLAFVPGTAAFLLAAFASAGAGTS
jgi:hypothetical protein